MLGSSPEVVARDETGSDADGDVKGGLMCGCEGSVKVRAGELLGDGGD